MQRDVDQTRERYCFTSHGDQLEKFDTILQSTDRAMVINYIASIFFITSEILLKQGLHHKHLIILILDNNIILIVLICGLPRVGKSTLARDLAPLINAIVISHNYSSTYCYYRNQ